MNWTSKLQAGDVVYIRRPWLDKAHHGGKIIRARVTKRISEHAILSGKIIFFNSSGGPYSYLERPTKKLLAEYAAQKASRQ